jgi:exopolysaccharide production protein ExoY
VADLVTTKLVTRNKQDCVGRELRVAANCVRESDFKPGFSGREAHEQDPRPSAVGGLQKRALDVAVAGFALLALTPIMFMTAVLIRSVMGKPIVMSEELIGFGGRVFARYKFRTTVGDASANLRVEYIAEALRRSGLENLPQLFNVIGGDMSLIGPRPRVADELVPVAQAPWCVLARPGLIGTWRGYRWNVGDHLTETALDRHYVCHWSMRLDLALLIKAISSTDHDDRTA